MVDAGRERRGSFYGPGPIVEAEILQAAHPIFYGIHKRLYRFVTQTGRYFHTPNRDRGSQVFDCGFREAKNRVFEWIDERSC
jgi:hypothetical protein